MTVKDLLRPSGKQQAPSVQADMPFNENRRLLFCRAEMPPAVDAIALNHLFLNSVAKTGRSEMNLVRENTEIWGIGAPEQLAKT
ncbi:hypothetical protein [Leptolyngbya iicbica]|uniref:Uncharacterized protein n=2 Tax=Cyanophyceae TaxID=3028117 RepID=A0A4Q7E069_9CYAN|nr:hypothetical protein [Leptolyngbya sp. LK]RZM74376.1 hypothetical protein DYY88_23775 [Leptolyngbya sp. LK]